MIKKREHAKDILRKAGYAVGGKVGRPSKEERADGKPLTKFAKGGIPNPIKAKRPHKLNVNIVMPVKSPGMSAPAIPNAPMAPRSPILSNAPSPGMMKRGGMAKGKQHKNFRRKQ